MPLQTWHRASIAAYAVAVLLIAMTGSIAGTSNLSATASLAFCAKLILLAAPALLLRREPYVLHPLVLLGALALLREVPGELGLLLGGLPTHTGLPGFSADEVGRTVSLKWALDALALAATYVGFVLAGRTRGIGVALGPPKGVERKVLVATVVALAGVAVLATASGSLDALALQRGVRSYERVQAEIGGHWNVVAAIGTGAVLAGAALVSRPLRSPTMLLAVPIAMIARFVTTGSKGGTLSILVLFALIVAARRGRIRPLSVGLLVMAVVLSVPVLDAFRSESRNLAVITDFEYSSDLAETVSTFIESLTLYSTEGTTDYPIYGRVPDQEPLLLGRSYAAILAAPVPRVLWPDKPPGIGRLAATRLLDRPAGAVPPSSAGEAYWNFLTPGVIGIHFVFGAFLAWLWRSVVRSRQSAPALLVVLVVTVYALSPQTSQFYSWLHRVVPLLVILIWTCGWRGFYGRPGSESFPRELRSAPVST